MRFEFYLKTKKCFPKNTRIYFSLWQSERKQQSWEQWDLWNGIIIWRRKGKGSCKWGKMLCILTSKQLLCRSFAGKNQIFRHFGMLFWMTILGVFLTFRHKLIVEFQVLNFLRLWKFFVFQFITNHLPKLNATYSTGRPLKHVFFLLMDFFTRKKICKCQKVEFNQQMICKALVLRS